MATTDKDHFEVLKFALKLEPELQIEMPRHAQLLSVHVEEEAPYLWALVYAGEPWEVREFHLAWSGQKISMRRPMEFVDTFRMPGAAVCHLFAYTFIKR